ncbi:MAG: hypothetical protein E6G50_13240 [Actinobacteria bacterium]|nr:MAG: hypothetical protein E6G50_13240 [Actinomycetota bacterium]
MVGRATALLIVVAALAVYDAVHASLWDASNWWDVAFIALVLIPATFVLVWLMLALRTARGLLPAGLALAVLTAALHVGGWNTAENVVKLFAVTFVAFWFLAYFETASWVVLVAFIIPWVDAYSVWRGPTKVIVTHHEHVFTTLSYAFPVPGEHTAANLGLPDLLFFALFLAASVRFGLRPGWTWLAMTASFGATIAIAVALELGGLPALPLLSLGFLAPNADLLWSRMRGRPVDVDGAQLRPNG